MNKLFGLFLSFVISIAPINTGRATLVLLPSPIAFPGTVSSLTGSPTFANLLSVSAAGHYTSYILSARENMTVSHVGFRAGTATGSPTAEVRIETVDASGLPSGTLWNTNTNGTTGTVSSDTNVLQALTASASITKGQIFCIKIAYASGTSLVIQSMGNISPIGPTGGLPYVVNNTGTPTKAITGGNINAFVLGSSSTTFYSVPGTMGISNLAGATFNNTNSAKRGLKFTSPMNCRVIGFRFWAVNSVGDYNAAIFDSSGTAIGGSSTAFDGDQNGNITAGGMTYVYFTNPVTLTAGTAYYAAVEPTTTTNANMPVITVVNTNYLSSTPAGSAAVYSSFASGSWTDSTTQIPIMDVLIDQVDNGAGSGGGGRTIGG